MVVDELLPVQCSRVQNVQAKHSPTKNQAYVQQWQEDSVHSEPRHEVHQTLTKTLQEPARLSAQSLLHYYGIMINVEIAMLTA